jgi:hypothetical protein
MLAPKATVKVKTRSADSALGQAAVTSPQTFVQILSVDPARITRTNTLLGNLTVTSSSSKEIAPGGRRTLMRFDLKPNGSALPAASAYVVLITPPGSAAVERGVEAFSLLAGLIAKLGLLAQPSDTSDADIFDITSGTGMITLDGSISATPSGDTDVLITNVISAVIGGEG